MRFGNRSQMWRVDDQFAAFLDDSAELVTCLASDPEFVVMLVEQGHDSLVFSAGVFDMDLAADFRGVPESRAKISGKQRVGAKTIVIFASDH